MGAYLIDHPGSTLRQYSLRTNWTPGQPTGLTVGHTTESILDVIGDDSGAEDIAAYIRRRTTPGSYHDVVDTDSRITVVPYEFGAWQDGTGSNGMAMSLAFACRTTDWATMGPERRKRMLRQGALAFADQQAWLKAHGHPTTPPRLIKKAQSDAGMAGFIGHGHRDPSRRTDPGTVPPNLFPWEQFFTACRAALAGDTPVPVIPEDDMPLTLTAVDTKRIYVWDGDSLWHTGDPVLAGAIGKIRNIELNQRQIDVIRADVQRRSRDRLAAVAKAASGDPVDLDALVRQLVADLADPLAGAITAKASGGGLSRDDVVEALREVLRAGVGSPAA
jgi:hypothetical protein